MKTSSLAIDFDKPVRIAAYKPHGLDIMFYALGLSVGLGLLFVLNFMHGGKIMLYFVLWRVLLSIPILLITLLFYSLLKELSVYTPKLLKKPVWTLRELMALTKKDEQETRRIMTRVLETAFILDEGSILSE